MIEAIGDTTVGDQWVFHQQRNGEYHALTMGEASGVGDTTGNIPDETVVHGECLQVDTVVS